MINTVWGITHLPFQKDSKHLLPQQQQIVDIIQIHAQQGGFSVILGEPGVGKTCLREHLQQLGNTRETCVVNCSRTMHTYRQILYQLADAFAIDTQDKTIENDLIKTAFDNVKARKALYILIDEAHLLDIQTLRKLWCTRVTRLH
ncbi:AAA family ATPase [Agaribacter flavus]|uniref:AAA family ATPase n=1 Tax=Agaribacter flavus TaxID=1902781 RepID=A0ABV7FLC0_9ALTE